MKYDREVAYNAGVEYARTGGDWPGRNGLSYSDTEEFADGYYAYTTNPTQAAESDEAIASDRREFAVGEAAKDLERHIRSLKQFRSLPAIQRAPQYVIADLTETICGLEKVYARIVPMEGA